MPGHDGEQSTRDQPAPRQQRQAESDRSGDTVPKPFGRQTGPAVKSSDRRSRAGRRSRRSRSCRLRGSGGRGPCGWRRARPGRRCPPLVQPTLERAGADGQGPADVPHGGLTRRKELDERGAHPVLGRCDGVEFGQPGPQRWHEPAHIATAPAPAADDGCSR